MPYCDEHNFYTADPATWARHAYVDRLAGRGASRELIKAAAPEGHTLPTQWPDRTEAFRGVLRDPNENPSHEPRGEPVEDDPYVARAARSMAQRPGDLPPGQSLSDETAKKADDDADVLEGEPPLTGNKDADYVIQENVAQAQRQRRHEERMAGAGAPVPSPEEMAGYKKSKDCGCDEVESLAKAVARISPAQAPRFLEVAKKERRALQQPMPVSEFRKQMSNFRDEVLSYLTPVRKDPEPDLIRLKKPRAGSDESDEDGDDEAAGPRAGPPDENQEGVTKATFPRRSDIDSALADAYTPKPRGDRPPLPDFTAGMPMATSQRQADPRRLDELRRKLLDVVDQRAEARGSIAAVKSRLQERGLMKSDPEPPKDLADARTRWNRLRKEVR